SYLGKPTLIPWNSLQAQFGADYSRPRDFRRRVSKYLEAVLGIYPAVRLSQSKSGLRLYPSPPHIGRAPVSTSGIGRGTKSLEVGGRRSRTP
ncbi:MAG: hypothetical protein WBO53_15410, partial [Thermoanaerobaculia bacterium]